MAASKFYLQFQIKPVITAIKKENLSTRNYSRHLEFNVYHDGVLSITEGRLTNTYVCYLNGHYILNLTNNNNILNSMVESCDF